MASTMRTDPLPRVSFKPRTRFRAAAKRNTAANPIHRAGSEAFIRHTQENGRAQGPPLLLGIASQYLGSLCFARARAILRMLALISRRFLSLGFSYRS